VKLIWSPDDGSSEPGAWEFSPNKLLVSEIEAIEKVTGQTFTEWAESMDRGSVGGLRALVWILRKRYQDPTLKYRDVDFPVGWVDMEPDPDDQVDQIDEDAGEPAPKGEEAQPTGAGG
jgi:hypothetical protein